MSRIGFLVGFAFGFVIAAARINDYDVIHNMLLLRDPQLYLLMGAAVAVAGPLLWLLERRRWRTPFGGLLELERAPIERKHVFGAALFGLGWAITGTCPGPALALPATGSLLGLITLAGVFAGIFAREAVVRRAAGIPSEAIQESLPPGTTTALLAPAAGLERP